MTEIKIYVFKAKRIPKLKYWLYIPKILILLAGKYFRTLSHLEIDGYSIGRYGMSEALKISSSKKGLAEPHRVILFRRFFQGLKNISTRIPTTITFGIVEYPAHTNGIIGQMLSRLKIPFYTHYIGLGIRIKNYEKWQLEDLFCKLYKRVKNRKIRTDEAESFLIQCIKHQDHRSYMKKVPKTSHQYQLSSVTHIVYLHSFTDDELHCGLDGFYSMYEWATFTIENLLESGRKNIATNPHPYFFTRSF